MPYKWERALRRDSELWDDFTTFLDDLEANEMQRLVGVQAAQHDRQAGIVEGIRTVRNAATAEEREELARARR